MGQIHTDVQRIKSELKRTTNYDKVYVEEKLAAGGNFSSTKSNTTSLKLLLAKETSKEVESKSNPTSVIARLMGLAEDFPAKEPVVDHAKRDFRNSQSCNHLKLTEKASQQQEQHHSMQSVRQVIHPSCKTIQYNDVYEGCEDEASMRVFQDQSSQRRSHSENKNCRMDVAPEKFRQAKYHVTEENLLHSRGLQESLDVLSSDKDLFLKFGEEPILPRRLSGPHTTTAPPHTRITVLKPIRSVQSDGAGQSTTERDIEKNGSETRRFHQMSSSNEGLPSQSSKIVLLRPTPGKPSFTKAKLTPKATPFRLIDRKNFRALDDHGSTLCSTGVLHDIIWHQQDGRYQRDEPLSSTYSNGYCGDESSSGDSEIDRNGDSEIDYIEEDGGSFSDSEAGSPISKYSWDYTRRYGSSFSGSSSSKMSHFPDSLVIKEAKQRLSERWAMVSCDDISQEQVQLPRTCTLGEILSLNEVKKEDATTCRKDDNTGERSRKLPRSKSVPVSLDTFDNMATKVQASNPESCKPTTDLMRRVSDFLFSKRKTIRQKSTYHPSDCFDKKIDACFGDSQLPASHHKLKSNEKLALCEEKIDISARQNFTSTSEGTASVDVPISLICRSRKLDRLGLHEGLNSTRDQPSPTSVLDAPSEDISCNEPESSGRTTSKNTKAASRSLAIEAVACALSWDDVTSESPFPGIPRPPCLPSDVDDDDESECYVLVQNIMSSAGLDDARSSIAFTGWHLPDCPLDPVLCSKLLELREQRSYQRLLVDCVNVALVEIGENALLSAFSWSKAHTRTWRDNSPPALGVEVWSILKDWIYGARVFAVGRRDNTRIMVDRVVKQEVEGSGWVKMKMSQVVDITEQIEGRVLEELVAEAVFDFAACCFQR